MSQAAKEAMKNFKVPGKGVFGGFGALLGVGALAYGINDSLFNGMCCVICCKGECVTICVNNS
jgi:hypothetical protein